MLQLLLALGDLPIVLGLTATPEEREAGYAATDLSST